MAGSRTASLRDRVRSGPSIIKQLPGIDAGLVGGVARYTVFERKVGAPSLSTLRAQLQIPENLFQVLAWALPAQRSKKSTFAFTPWRWWPRNHPVRR
jgi:hypothetical protein